VPYFAALKPGCMLTLTMQSSGCPTFEHDLTYPPRALSAANARPRLVLRCNRAPPYVNPLWPGAATMTRGRLEQPGSARVFPA
jgi:hypothetical protein